MSRCKRLFGYMVTFGGVAAVLVAAIPRQPSPALPAPAVQRVADDEKGEGSADRVRDWAAVGSLITILSLVALGGIRFLYEDTLRPLGVSPDELGISNAHMLTVSSVVLLAAAALFALPIMAGRMAGGDAGRKCVTILVVLAAEFVAMTFLSGIWIFYGALGSTLVLMTIPFAPKAGIFAKLSTVQRLSAGAASAPLVLLAVAVILWFPAAATTSDLSRNLVRGERGRSMAAAVLSLYSRPVCVITAANNGLHAPEGPAGLLGGSDGHYVLIEQRNHQLWRVPSDAIALRSRSGVGCG